MEVSLHGGGDGGGGGGGDGGGGDEDGGGGESASGGGGEAATEPTEKLSCAALPDEIENVWPQPDHCAPFQPSPHESSIDSVHAPDTSCVVGPYGAPPLSEVPSEQLSVQLTSLA